MRFPNAYDGVKKIRTANILSIIVILLTFVAALMVGVAAVSAAGGSAGGALGSVALAGTLGLVAGVIAIIAFIMEIVGINKAKNDDAEFSKAMTFLIIGIVASVISNVVNQALVKSIFSLASSACSAYVTVCVIAGVASLAVQAGDNAFAATANSAKNTILMLLVAEFLLNFVSGLVKGTFSIILSVCGLIAGIVGLVMYLNVLKGAEEMLRKAVVVPTADGSNSDPFNI